MKIPLVRGWPPDRKTQPATPTPAGQTDEDEKETLGVSLRLWRLYVMGTFICLLYPLFSTHPAPLRLVSSLLVLGCFVPLCAWLMWPHPVSTRTRPRSREAVAVVLTLLTALVLLLSLVAGSVFLWLLVCVSAAVGMTLSMRSAFVVVTGLMVLTVGANFVLSGGNLHANLPQTILLVLLVRAIGIDVIGLARFSSTIRELHAARRSLARMAVMEERLRVARDLHDLLGHTLSLLALKSELAGRLMEHQPAQAAREIHDVEEVARQTLREVREAVAGYRQPTLQGELEGACQLLEAAGMTHQVEHTAPKLPAALDAALAWVVREGVTNVVRHSRARRCRIRVTQAAGWVRAEVTNDERRSAKHELALRTSPAPGSGLAGLAERVVALGGHVEAGPLLVDGFPGFRLQVELPIPPPEPQGTRAVLVRTHQSALEEAAP